MIALTRILVQSNYPFFYKLCLNYTAANGMNFFDKFQQNVNKTSISVEVKISCIVDGRLYGVLNVCVTFL